jgi:dUTP pyrophosphatase
MMMRVKIKKLSEDAVIPEYSREGDAAMDVVAVSKKTEDNFIEYGTGLAFEIPKGHVMLVFPRSSVTKTDFVMANSVGVIDSGYRGELKIRFNVMGLRGHYEVGDRVAQIMILPYPRLEFEEVDELGKSDRGEGGFGSTGK